MSIKLRLHRRLWHRSPVNLRQLIVTALVLSRIAVSQVTARDPPASSEILLNAAGGNEAFAAVGYFQSLLTCTGSLIDPSAMGAADAKAWLLTAGHCISLEPHGVIRNQPLTARVVFKYFVDIPPAGRVTVRTRATGWATMKGSTPSSRR